MRAYNDINQEKKHKKNAKLIKFNVLAYHFQAKIKLFST